MALMEATHLAAKPVGEMSAGEMRRIMIARALVHRPEMLLLDEPSNALDLRAQRDLRETLRRLVGQGSGLLLVTHHLPDVLPEIDRVIMMRDGRIFADGPKRELLTADRLGELFGRPIDVVEREEYFHALA
jgi:iron complex transport system ATP-binding protein